MKKILCVFVAGITLASCATKKEMIDTTPKNSTAVLTANTAISGYILPDSTGTQTVFTRNIGWMNFLDDF